MEEKQKKKFVCKFCNKRFPCGKSLGGHIRTHLNKKPTLEKEEIFNLLTMSRMIVKEEEFYLTGTVIIYQKELMKIMETDLKIKNQL